MYFKNMKTYTTREVAEKTGKTLQAISRYAQTHPGIGQKFGRDWIFTEEDVKKLEAVKMGPPIKHKRTPKPVAPPNEEQIE